MNIDTATDLGGPRGGPRCQGWQDPFNIRWPILYYNTLYVIL